VPTRRKASRSNTAPLALTTLRRTAPLPASADRSTDGSDHAPPETTALRTTDAPLASVKRSVRLPRRLPATSVTAAPARRRADGTAALTVVPAGTV
jgi:hypothetical protein